MEEKKVLLVTSRSASSSKEKLAFRADVEPTRTIKGKSLAKKMSEMLNITEFEALMAIAHVDAFIKQALQEGMRLDFEYATYYPSLSAALPSIDADPETSGVKPIGAVTPRKALRDLLKGSIALKNSHKTSRAIKFYVWNLTRKSSKSVRAGDDLYCFANGFKTSQWGVDDFVSLEVHTAAGSKVVQKARITSTDEKKGYIHFTFDEPLVAGRKYFIVVNSREGQGQSYQYRRHRYQFTGV